MLDFGARDVIVFYFVYISLFDTKCYLKCKIAKLQQQWQQQQYQQQQLSQQQHQYQQPRQSLFLKSFEHFEFQNWNEVMKVDNKLIA